MMAKSPYSYVRVQPACPFAPVSDELVHVVPAVVGHVIAARFDADDCGSYLGVLLGDEKFHECLLSAVTSGKWWTASA